MSKTTEKARFEQRFTDEVIEIAAVTGALGVGGGKGGNQIYWSASIKLIAWQNLHNNEPIKKEEVSLQWLADDEQLKKSRELLNGNTVVRLQVRMGTLKGTMKLVKVLDTAYNHSKLEEILKEAMKPVYYYDEVFGRFELDKGIKTFESEIIWGKEKGYLYFDLDDEAEMKASLKTAYELFNKENQWKSKIKNYACKELLELANEWLQDDDEAEVDEITEDMFINLMKLDTISVYPDGEFDIFFYDGDMFWGHSITVYGNINGELSSANIEG